MSGNVQQKTLSRSYQTNTFLISAVKIFLLIATGIIAITLHSKFRSPLNIPGHHGIEFMAIIVGSRLASNIKWASSISALGIGIFILFPVLGFKDPMMGFNYMLPCFITDLAYNYIPKNKVRNIFLGIAGGLAYMMIPLSRLLTHFYTGYPYSSFLKHGYITPVILFFIFGLLGGFIGIGIFTAIRKFFNNYISNS